MKSLLLAALLALPSFAATIITDPIPVSGGGSFLGDGFDDGTSVSFSGGIDGHRVTVFYRGDRISASSTGTGGTANYTTGVGSAGIDDIGSGYFTFGVGNGNGWLIIFSPADGATIVAQAALAGWITNYSVTHTPGSPPITSGSFSISATLPNPEPSTFALAGLALVWLMAGALKAGHPQPRLGHSLK